MINQDIRIEETLQAGPEQASNRHEFITNDLQSRVIAERRIE
jgi:hypothetical protein